MRIRTWHYSSMEPLYRGPLGIVHKARCESKDGRFDAVTHIDPALDYEAVVAGLDARMARVGALRSPLLRRDRGLVEVNGRLALSSVLVDGVPLRLLVSGQPIPPRVACGIAGRVALALHTAYDRLPRRKRKPYRLVHGDLSPVDVLIGPAGDLRVDGLGLRVGSPTEANPLRDHLPRPSPWSAPELAEGPAGHGADVYALAAMLAWMLTGRPPGYASAESSWHEGSVGGTAQQVREITGENALAELIAWCMSHTPGSRPRAEEVHAWLLRLDAALDGPEWAIWAEQGLRTARGMAAEELFAQDPMLDDPRNAPPPRGLRGARAGVRDPSEVDVPWDAPSEHDDQVRRTVASVVVDPARRARDLGLLLPRAEAEDDPETEETDTEQFAEVDARAVQHVQVALKRAAAEGSGPRGLPGLRLSLGRLEAEDEGLITAHGAPDEELVMGGDTDEELILAAGDEDDLLVMGGAAEAEELVMGGAADDEELIAAGEADEELIAAGEADEELIAAGEADEELIAAGEAADELWMGSGDDEPLPVGEEVDEIWMGADEDAPSPTEEELFETSDGDDTAGMGISLSLGSPRTVGARGVQPSGGTVRVQLGQSRGSSSWNRDDLTGVDLPEHLFKKESEAGRSTARARPLPSPPLRGVRLTMPAPDSHMDGFIFEGSEADAIEATAARGRQPQRQVESGTAAVAVGGAPDEPSDREASDATASGTPQTQEPSAGEDFEIPWVDLSQPPAETAASDTLAPESASEAATASVSAKAPAATSVPVEPPLARPDEGPNTFRWAVGLACLLIIGIVLANPLFQQWRAPVSTSPPPSPTPAPSTPPVETASVEAASVPPEAPEEVPEPGEPASTEAAPSEPTTPSEPSDPSASASAAPRPAAAPPTSSTGAAAPPSRAASSAPAARSRPSPAPAARAGSSAPAARSRPSPAPVPAARTASPPAPAPPPRTPAPSDATPWPTAEPSPAPAAAAPTPAPPPEAAPAPPEAAPAPPEAAPAPPAAAPAPVPAESAATAQPSPEDEAPAEAGPPKGALEVRGDASSVRIVQDGQVYGAGEVPVGRYRIMASFGPGMPAVDYGELSIAEGRTSVVVCNATFMACKVR